MMTMINSFELLLTDKTAMALLSAWTINEDFYRLKIRNAASRTQFLIKTKSME